MGRLANTKQWLITTPAVVLLENGTVIAAWEARAPDLDELLEKLGLADPVQTANVGKGGGCDNEVY